MSAPDLGIIGRELKRIFDADSGLDGAGLTPLYAEEAPRQIDRPYAVLYDIGNTPTERTSHGELTVNRLQFSFFANSRSAIRTAIRLTRGAYRRAASTIDLAPDGLFHQLKYVGARLVKDDENIWQGILEYDLHWAEDTDSRDG